MSLFVLMNAYILVHIYEIKSKDIIYVNLLFIYALKVNEIKTVVSEKVFALAFHG